MTAPAWTERADPLAVRRVVAAAATGISPLLDHPGMDGVVVGVPSQAVIVRVATADGPRMLCLLTSAATGVPNGVRIAGVSSLRGHRSGDPVRIGGGRVRTGRLDITIVRRWSSAVPRITRIGGIAELAATADAAPCGVPPAALASLCQVLAHDGDPSAAIDALVGLGQGLTPGGDDVIAGLLTGLHATGRGDLARRFAGADRWTERTTMLSADLIRLAAVGHACVEILALLTALHSGAPLSAPIHRLLSIGHTSGADLATGLAIGLQVGAVRQEAR